MTLHNNWTPKQFFSFCFFIDPPLSNDFVCMKCETMGIFKHTNQVEVVEAIFLTTTVLLYHVSTIQFHRNCWNIKQGSWYEFMYQLNLFLSINSCICCWVPLANILHLVHIIASNMDHTRPWLSCSEQFYCNHYCGQEIFPFRFLFLYFTPCRYINN